MDTWTAWCRPTTGLHASKATTRSGTESPKVVSAIEFEVMLQETTGDSGSCASQILAPSKFPVETNY